MKRLTTHKTDETLMRLEEVLELQARYYEAAATFAMEHPELERVYRDGKAFIRDVRREERRHYEEKYEEN